MKAIRAAVQDAVDSGASTLVYCLRIERTDGEVFRFTNHDKQLEMNNGSVYEPDRGGADVSQVNTHADLSPTTFDLEGALTANGVQRKDIAAGLFDFASLYLFRTLWDDPVEDDDPIAKGYWGKAELADERFVTECRSLATLLEQKVGRVHGSTCDADLGDTRCKVRLQPPEWAANTAYSVREAGAAESGSVVRPTTENGAHFKCITAGTSGSSEPAWDTTIGNTTSDGSVVWEAIRALRQTDTVVAVTDSGEFTGGLGFPDEWFGAGTVTFLTGANAGIEREVKTYAADVYTMWQGFPYTVAAGDQFTAQAGCRKRFQADCIDKFDNAFNYQGFPDIPGTDAASKFGGQG